MNGHACAPRRTEDLPHHTCGQPARDHRGRAFYAVYEDGQMELRQTPYAVGRTAALLRAAPLSNRVIEGLIGVLGYEG